MLQPITFKVDMGDKQIDVQTSAADYAAYEEKFDRSAPMSLDRYSFYMFVIWNAMRRNQKTDLSYEDWLNEGPTFDRELESDEPAPLDQTAPTG